MDLFNISFSVSSVTRMPSMWIMPVSYHFPGPSLCLIFEELYSFVFTRSSPPPPSPLPLSLPPSLFLLISSPCSLPLSLFTQCWLWVITRRHQMNPIGLSKTPGELIGALMGEYMCQWSDSVIISTFYSWNKPFPVLPTPIYQETSSICTNILELATHTCHEIKCIYTDTNCWYHSAFLSTTSLSLCIPLHYFSLTLHPSPLPLSVTGTFGLSVARTCVV